jgi:hypothetical protein
MKIACFPEQNSLSSASVDEHQHQLAQQSLQVRLSHVMPPLEVLDGLHAYRWCRSEATFQCGCRRKTLQKGHKKMSKTYVQNFTKRT